MAFYTKEEARAASRGRYASAKTDARILEEAASTTRDSERFDIFLSHSSRDAAVVRGIKLIMESQGFTVYVDWIADPELDRSRVTKATALLLRKRMGQCKSLIYAATTNSSSSLWMPWELGYFDGLRQSNVAILPLTDHPGEHFQGQEYLGLYPLVTKGTYTNGRPEVFVEDFGRNWATLSSFARGAPAWTPYK